MSEEEIMYILQERERKEKEKNKSFIDRVSDMSSGISNMLGGATKAYNVLDNVTQYGMHNLSE